MLEPQLSEAERSLRVAKYMLLKSMGYGFTEYMTVKIARNDMPEHQFKGAIRKTLNGLYQGSEGFDEAELEITAVQLGVDEIIWPIENGKEKETTGTEAH